MADSETAVRLEAAEAIGRTTITGTVAKLSDALLDPVTRVRRAAILSLSDLGTDAAAITLRTALHGADAGVQEEAVYALGDMAGIEAQAALELALTDPDEMIRMTAQEMLDDRKIQRGAR